MHRDPYQRPRYSIHVTFDINVFYNIAHYPALEIFLNPFSFPTQLGTKYQPVMDRRLRFTNVKIHFHLKATTITLPPGSPWTSGLHWHETYAEYLQIIRDVASVHA